MSKRRRRLASILTLAVVALPGVADAAPATLRWTPCHAEVGPRFECAVAQVPLDYDRPRGRDDLARAHPPAGHRSAAPDRLAVPEPGRPGRVGRRLRPRRRAVPLHARGPGALRPRRLRPARHHPQHAAALLRQRRRSGRRSRRSAFPITRAQEQQQIAFDRALDRACRERGGPIRDHMSTANVARDMDVLRELVGDAKLSTPASPTAPTSASRTRTCSPAACARSWSTACSTRSRGRPAATPPRACSSRSRPACAATRARRRRCRSSSACATPAGRAARSRAAPRRASPRSPARSLREPVEVTYDDGTTETIDYTLLIAITLGAMYDSPIWPDFAGFLAFVEAAGATSRIAGTIPRPDVERRPRYGIEENYLNFPEGFPGVACSDSINPRSLRSPGRSTARSPTRSSATSAGSGPGPRASAPSGRATTRTATSARGTASPRTRCWWSATASTPPRATRAR